MRTEEFRRAETIRGLDDHAEVRRRVEFFNARLLGDRAANNGFGAPLLWQDGGQEFCHDVAGAHYEHVLMEVQSAEG